QQFEPKMPYHLPPGERSQEKPTLPYAALIGQALLASYFHRLPLHDITTYITLVHPYYKRSDATWQNSLRHNLSTNDSFQRVDRHP
ncbi:winged helix DNA-binding domain-containing protein, partial [Auricularia subglabra TFB-10046 SS5]